MKNKKTSLHGFEIPVVFTSLFLATTLVLPAQNFGGFGNRGGRGFGGVDPNQNLATQIVSQGDQNADEQISSEEMTALADAWFDKLDEDSEGNVSQQDFSQRFGGLLDNNNQAGGQRQGRGQGRGGFGGRGGRGGGDTLAQGLFLVADANKDAQLSEDELKAAFEKWFADWKTEDSDVLNEEAILAGLNKSLPQQVAAGRGGQQGGRGPAREPDLSPKPAVKALSPDEQAAAMELPEGYKLELVVSEPIIKEPVVTVFDGNGRMYVAEMRTYMQDIDGNNEHDPESRISRHEDKDGDGEYDKHTVFIDNMVLPRFILPWDKNSILSMETDTDDVFRYIDEDGDGVSDKKELFVSGVGRRGNLEHQQSGMVWAMDNWIYTTYNNFRVRWTPDGVIREQTGSNGGQWGLSQDNYGLPLFVNAGVERGPVNFQVPIAYGAFSVSDQFEEGFEVPHSLVNFGDYQGGMGRVADSGALNHITSSAGIATFRGDRLPEDMQNDLFFGEPVARLVRRAEVVKKDGLTQLQNSHPGSEFMRTPDPLFRPVNVTTAPDGTLYITDMYRGIIQEGNWVRAGSYLRQKVEQYQLDKIVGLGRIWRVVHEDFERDLEQPRMYDETPAELVSHLEHPNGWWRDTAQQILVVRQDKSVVPALEEMARNSESEFGRMHALWTLEGLNALDASLVREAMQDENPNLRVQALRLSESLYKGGDTSIVADIKALGTDPSTDVVIQSMLTMNKIDAPDAASFIRSMQVANASRGVQEIGGQLGSGQENFGDQFTAAERTVLQRGKAIYQELCYACHGEDGKGMPMAGMPEGTLMAPSMAGSMRIQGHPEYAVNAALYGLNGPIDGETYTAGMVAMGANNDEWISAVISYIRNGFGNSASFVTPEQVAEIRKQNGERTLEQQWIVSELEAASPSILAYEPTWKVTPSHNSDTAGYAINSFGNFEWTTGEAQKPGMWFQIEFPGAAQISGIELISNGNAGGESPREYQVSVSQNGSDWGTPVATGTSGSSKLMIPFEPTEAKFIRVTQTGANSPLPWTIQKTRIFQPGEDIVPTLGVVGQQFE